MSDVVSKVWRCLRGLAARLALAATSLLLFCVAAELIFRAFVAPPELFELREGVYVHSLPQLNGREVLVPSWPERPPMQEEKAPNELRVFVFGESSVYGAPFHPVATAPAMLKDLLQERYPDRKVSVANMGRGSAYTLDSYYYMVAFERFEPDVMVFYQGTNDRFDYDAELCAPVHYPRAYAFYRWLVERSRLLWAVRAYGPQYLRAGRSGEAGSSYPDGMPREPKCGHAEGFVGWARILMETAQEMGATAVVKFHLQKGEAARNNITFPRFAHPGYFIAPEWAAPRNFIATMGMPIREDGTQEGEDLTLAARNALINMIDLLQERGWTKEQAYVICSVAVDLKISNVVDLPNVTVSAFLPEDIFQG